MNGEQRTQPSSWVEVTVKSDRLTTVGAVVALVGCCLLLVSEIRRFVWGHFVQATYFHRDSFGIPIGAYLVITGILCLMLAFEFPKRLVKAAFFLMGIDFAAAAYLSFFFHISPATFHLVAMIRSMMRQIALLIFVVSLAQWLRSVIISVSPPEPPRGDS